MQKLGFPTMRSLDQLKSFKTPLSGAVKVSPILIPTTPPSESINYGSFTTLKLTAEKLIQEQVSVKTDLEMAHKKLIRATEQIHMLEAKLQDAINESAKLRMKQNEDAKLWKELDSKVSSTKALSDQLTETLKQLADQTHAAEEDKKFFEEKLLENSKAFDEFNSQLNDLCLRLDSAGNTIRAGEEKLLELRHEKERMEKSFRDDKCRTDNILMDKDTHIKQLEDVVEENKIRLQTVNSQLHEAQHELTLKEEICNSLRDTEEVLRKEKYELQCTNRDLGMQLDRSLQETRELDGVIHGLVTKIVEMEKENSSVSNHVAELLSTFETFYRLAQQEKDLALKCNQGKFDKLHEQFLNISSVNDAFKAETEKLKDQVMELQKAQEFIMVQHAEECRLAEDKIRRLESEVENLVLKKYESENLAADLGKKLKDLSEASSVNENNMKDLLTKISKLEDENQNLEEKVRSVLQEKSGEVGVLQDEIMKRDQEVDSLHSHINQLQNALNEKEKLHGSSLQREKELEEQKTEMQTLVTASECKLTEERKQFELMLEGKQLELSKHLKELSQRNDQAINEIRRKYEEEKVEIAKIEKEKADKLVKVMERNCDEKLSVQREEAQKYLLQVQVEHGATISKIRQDNNQNESSLKARQKEELQRVQLEAENEMRERISSLRKEHEIQIKSLKLEHEDNCRRLQEELEIQRSKEEKQRALLQLQWKVMGESQQGDQEVNSKKDYSVSSIKKNDSYGGKERRLALPTPESRRKDVALSGLIRTPVSNILKHGNTGSVVNIPKHSKKVTRHEYEVETSNGKTITKRRKTKSTVMFGEPNPRKAVRTKTPNANKDHDKMTKVPGGRPPANPANLGDLFSEGSLNPYADDPYAFD